MRNPCVKCEYVQKELINSKGKRHWYMCNKRPEYTCGKHEEYKIWLRSRRKYVKGNLITSLDELMQCELVYMMDVPKHIGFVSSMTLRTVNSYMKREMVFKAIRKENGGNE